jgi:glycosyltransferase involved in cell wall biosynthesis
MQKKLVVYLLSYKRPEFIHEAIISILEQDYTNFELIISENSPDDSVIKQLSKYLSDNRVKILKRTPSQPSLEHFNTILAEALKYEYVMLFHDDDLLTPQALSKMMLALESHDSSVAVACNAKIIKNTDHTNFLLSPYIKSNLEIKSQSQLINRYIFKKLSHPAFPSYIYRSKYLIDLKLNPQDGGKYSDVSFLVKLIKKGSFFWIAEPLMKYRQHSSNDSVQIDLNAIFSLCLFFIKTSPKLLLNIIFYFSKQLAKKIIIELKK